MVIIAKVRENKTTHQKQVTIPKKETSIIDGDYVEIKKVCINAKK